MLAIAGLIDNYSAVASAITSYSGNHNGNLPGDLTELEDYINNNEISDPSSGIPYTDADADAGAMPTDANHPIWYRQGFECGENNEGVDHGENRRYAIFGYLESSPNTPYCVDN